MTLTFNSASSRLVIPVRIVNDAIDEDDEQLISRLELEPVEGDLPNVQVDPAQATLTIVDDDGEVNVARVESVDQYCFLYRSNDWCRTT